MGIIFNEWKEVRLVNRIWVILVYTMGVRLVYWIKISLFLITDCWADIRLVYRIEVTLG